MGWFGKKEKDESTRQSNNRRNNYNAPQAAPASQQLQQNLASAAPPQPAPAVALSTVPVTVRNQVSESAVLVEQNNIPVDETEKMIANEQQQHPVRDEKYDEEASRSYTREDESAEEVQSYLEAARQNHLNSLFNGHLMKWKFEAEEGSAFVRVPAFFGGLGLIATVIGSMVTQENAFVAHVIVMGVCVMIMGCFICILDGRFLATNPLSTRAHLRNILTRNFNMFRFVWGRGILYITAGIINIASQMWIVTIISGAYMVLIGFIAIIVGIHASRKFAALRNSLADESFLLLVFSNYDSDGDGYLAPNEFALLLSDLGMELDDRYTLKAFNVIDTDSDRRISFDEFNHWWASGYIERGRKRFHQDEDDDEESYRRLD